MPPITPARRILAAVLAGLLAFALAGTAQAAEEDLSGAKDHPLLTRYQGSWLVASESRDFEASQLPTSYERAGKRWAKAVDIEGERRRLVFVAPRGRSVLEVQRNYEQALAQAGAVRLLACTATQPCAAAVAAFQESYIDWVMDLPKANKVDLAFSALNSGRQACTHLLARLQRDGSDNHISVLTCEVEGTGPAALAGRAVTVLEVLRPRAMDSGMVTVASAEVLGSALAGAGRVALYGVYFDTGKADIKPESKAQLDEMAKLLNGAKALRVHVVGHTDNQGALEANIALSQRRAEAIKAALVKDYRIDAARLDARGLASFAPVASNAQEEGRARNRRVELVQQ